MNSHRRRRSDNGTPATLTVELGALAEHIRDQLRAQGIKLPLHTPLRWSERAGPSSS
jgi:hypothetical protein